MADTLGALALPAAVTTPAADPLLGYALDFFQHVLNANVGAAWSALYPYLAQPPVLSTSANNPTDNTFNENDLPQLCGWRTQGSFERLAEDLYERQSTLQLLWVMPPAEQTDLAARDPFINAVTAAMFGALERGRDPSWIVAGDADAQAATYGSVFATWAGYHVFNIAKFRDATLDIGGGDADLPKRSYPALFIDVDVRELLTLDDLTGAWADAVSVTTKTLDGGVGDGGLVTETFSLA